MIFIIYIGVDAVECEIEAHRVIVNCKATDGNTVSTPEEMLAALMKWSKASGKAVELVSSS